MAPPNGRIPPPYTELTICMRMYHNGKLFITAPTRRYAHLLREVGSVLGFKAGHSFVGRSRWLLT